MAYLSDFTSTSIGNNRILPKGSKFELELILILTLVLVLISHKDILHKTTLDELILVLSQIKSGEYLPYGIKSFYTPLGAVSGYVSMNRGVL